ncbi:tyrosine-type recombinase/integrase [Facklamia hominis]|uniref:tyrosine-type recombinase/integrase n=1 Tax=Facklamia hominis TaxID=178214 RepID=UPI0038FC672A
MASIKKDNQTGKWYCRVSYQEDDKYKTKTKKGFNTKKEAQVYANKLELILSENNGCFEDSGDTPFADYFEDWYLTYKAGKLSLTTDNSYQLNIRIVRKYFKKTPLNKITHKKYQAFLNWRGKGKSLSTLEKTHFKTQECFRRAFADGIISKDPSYGAVLNYDVKSDDRIVSLNLKQTSKLFEILSPIDEPKETILYVALSTGLRAGEVFGLSWEDIDLKNKTLSVKRGILLNSPYYFTSTKNKTSIRTIAVTDEFVQKITRYRLKYKIQCPEFVFLTKQKKPVISHIKVNERLKMICKTSGFPPLTMHKLRHTHCSVLLAQGVDVQYVSKRLGHATVNETLSTYAHVIDELHQIASKKAVEELSLLETKSAK